MEDRRLVFIGQKVYECKERWEIVPSCTLSMKHWCRNRLTRCEMLQSMHVNVRAQYIILWWPSYVHEEWADSCLFRWAILLWVGPLWEAPNVVIHPQQVTWHLKLNTLLQYWNNSRVSYWIDPSGSYFYPRKYITFVCLNVLRFAVNILSENF